MGVGDFLQSFSLEDFYLSSHPLRLQVLCSHQELCSSLEPEDPEAPTDEKTEGLSFLKNMIHHTDLRL